MQKKVLVVDDEPNIVISLKFLLENAGFDVKSESDGQSALDAIASSTPDVLVLDVMLPGLDGFQVLRELRSDPRYEKLPVLMLTAKGQREDRKTAIDTGADVFISKPFSNDEVVKAVQDLAVVCNE